MYREGTGVPQNARVAVNWYRKAAAQGLSEAQYNLGNMYENGKGVSKDNAEAAKWEDSAESPADESSRETIRIEKRRD